VEEASYCMSCSYEVPGIILSARPIELHRFDGVDIMSVTRFQLLRLQFKYCGITFVKTVVETGVRSLHRLDTSKCVMKLEFAPEN
jgi:hypothetical protein